MTFLKMVVELATKLQAAKEMNDALEAAVKAANEKLQREELLRKDAEKRAEHEASLRRGTQTSLESARYEIDHLKKAVKHYRDEVVELEYDKFQHLTKWFDSPQFEMTRDYYRVTVSPPWPTTVFYQPTKWDEKTIKRGVDFAAREIAKKLERSLREAFNIK